MKKLCIFIAFMVELANPTASYAGTCIKLFRDLNKKDIPKLFAEMDVNKDDSLTQKEMSDYTKRCNLMFGDGVQGLFFDDSYIFSGLDDDKDKVLSSKEFMTIVHYGTNKPWIGALPPYDPESLSKKTSPLKKKFAALDWDHDKHLSFMEYYGNTIVKITHDDQQDFFDAYDINHDKKLSFEELDDGINDYNDNGDNSELGKKLRIKNSSYPSPSNLRPAALVPPSPQPSGEKVKKEFNALDVDKDKRLSWDEYVRGMTGKTTFEDQLNFFHKYDVDHDDKLSFEEFDTNDGMGDDGDRMFKKIEPPPPQQ